MITKIKVKLYQKYNGDADEWARNNVKTERSVVSGNDWSLIDDLVQDLILVKNGLVSLEYSKSLDDRLLENCDSLETIHEIKNLRIDP